MPPSSSVSALDRLRAEPHDLAAGLRRAGEGDLVDARVLDEIGAGGRPVAGDDVDRAGREADLGRELGEPQRGQRRLRVGLEHDRAAGRERGRELPRRHQQRVVPGDDLAGDADRLLQRVGEERAADRVRAAADRADRGGEVAEVLDRAEELGLGRGDRLADVAGLELRELVPVRLDRVCERVQEPRALVRRRLAPVAVERGARGLDRAVDLGLARELRGAERLARGRLDQVAGGRALDGLAVDEEPVLVRSRRPRQDDSGLEFAHERAPPRDGSPVGLYATLAGARRAAS